MQEQHIAKRKLSNEVFDRLKRMIVDEAMQTLSNVDLIEINHGQRSRVLAFKAASIVRQMDQSVHILLQRSADSLGYLKTARIFFDRGMVREAGVKAMVVDLADLRVALEEQRQPPGDAQYFTASDMRFHERIAQISSNPIFFSASDAGFSWLLS